MMRVVIQRVLKASVIIDGIVHARIGQGLLVLLGIEHADSAEDADWLASKLVQLRIFGDEGGVMNKSVKDVAGGLLLVSQFTLHAATKKGNRPSYIKAARPEHALPLYHRMHRSLQELMERAVYTGEFGADMQIELVNDGPVTILIDSKNRE